MEVLWFCNASGNAGTVIQSPWTIVCNGDVRAHIRTCVVAASRTLDLAKHSKEVQNYPESILSTCDFDTESTALQRSLGIDPHN